MVFYSETVLYIFVRNGGFLSRLKLSADLVILRKQIWNGNFINLYVHGFKYSTVYVKCVQEQQKVKKGMFTIEDVNAILFTIKFHCHEKFAVP